MGMSVLLAFALIASDSTLLSQAKKASSTYSSEIAKASPPKSHPLPSEALDIGSVWFTIDKTQSEQFFNEVSQWSLIRDLGVESLKVEKMRQKGVLGLDPAFERTFQQLSQGAHNVSIQLIGKVLGNASSVGEDFQQALKNTPAYQNLYELIEIPEEDWKLLPKVPAGNRKSNVPWLQLQMLHNKGYVPQKFQPYVKETSWNATDEILGIDGKVRRWIYLKEKENNQFRKI